MYASTGGHVSVTRAYVIVVESIRWNAKASPTTRPACPVTQIRP